jgi:hypothetical protein
MCVEILQLYTPAVVEENTQVTGVLVNFIRTENEMSLSTVLLHL